MCRNDSKWHTPSSLFIFLRFIIILILHKPAACKTPSASTDSSIISPLSSSYLSSSYLSSSYLSSTSSSPSPPTLLQRNENTEAYPQNEWARTAISKAEIEFKDKPKIVDPNSNENTENQKAMFIAKDFLTAASSKFMDHEFFSDDEDRLVEFGRSIVDLVDLADSECGFHDEKVLMLGLQNVVDQCDILATDDLKASAN